MGKEQAETKKHAGSAAAAGGAAAGKGAGAENKKTAAAGKNMKTASDFAVSGTFLEKGGYKKFTKIVSAYSEPNARERVLSLMGSKHAVKRRHVKIESAKEAK